MKLFPVPTCFHLQDVDSFAQSAIPIAVQLDSSSSCQIIEVASLTPIFSNLEELAPHKNILGKSFPLLGQVTTLSANVFIGFTVVVPEGTTVTTCFIDLHGARAVLVT